MALATVRSLVVFGRVLVVAGVARLRAADR